VVQIAFFICFEGVLHQDLNLRAGALAPFFDAFVDQLFAACKAFVKLDVFGDGKLHFVFAVERKQRDVAFFATELDVVLFDAQIDKGVDVVECGCLKVGQRLVDGGGLIDQFRTNVSRSRSIGLIKASGIRRPCASCWYPAGMVWFVMVSPVKYQSGR
jgi:hypothetical protein